MITVLQHLPALLNGLLLTIMLLITAIAVGLSLALLLSFFLARKTHPLLSAIIHFYLWLFRGTPTLIQIFILYYGASQIDFIRHSFLWHGFKHPFFCAILALGLNTGAYTTALFSGTIRAIPSGEIEAAKAYGFQSFALYRYIILPRLISMVLPAYSNEVIMVLKSTSLASAITLLELTGVAQNMMGLTYVTMPFLLTAGALYLILNGTIVSLFNRWQRAIHHGKGLSA